MNECKHIPMIHAYLDGELRAEQAKTAEAHVQSCAQCAAELQSLRQMSGLFAEVKDAATPVPLEMMRRIHRQIDEAGEGRVFRLARQLTAVAAVILVAALVTLEVGRSSQSPSVSTPYQTPLAAKPWESIALMDSDSSNAGDEPAITKFMIRDLSTGLPVDSGGDQ